MSGDEDKVDGDVGDGSDLDTRPSCSNGRRRPPTKRVTNNNSKESPGEKKQKRRVVMRIKYIDESSDDDSSEHENNEPKVESINSRSSYRRRRALDPHISSDSSDSEVKSVRRPSSARDINSTSSKKLISQDNSEVENMTNSLQADILNRNLQVSAENSASDGGFNSDSSSNEALEKCPICLTTFREQEIGIPAPCDHIFCATCIEAWSKNITTCPIDRLNFDSILVNRSFIDRERVRVINVVSTDNKGRISEEEDVSHCAICFMSDREDVMLLCDCCNQGYHMDCITPSLSEVPEGLWFCRPCYEDGSVEDRNLNSPNIDDLFAELDAELGVLVSQVSELRAPRISRTLANERIRSRVLNDLRHSSSSTQRTVRTTTTTANTTRTRRVTRRRRRRNQSARTFVVEYEINNFDNKFALKTGHKIIRRRRRRRVKSKRRQSSSSTARVSARGHLGEQLGLPQFGNKRNGGALGGNTSLSIFGNPNALDYFSDDQEPNDGEVTIGSGAGAGAAVQTRVRLANYGSGNSIERKNLLLGRRRPRTPPVLATALEPVDLLGTIMDLQDRWHNAAKRINDVHINRDGTLAIPTTALPLNQPQNNSKTSDTLQKALQVKPEPANSQSSNNDQAPTVTQAPMYQRGGNNNYNRGGNTGGGTRGNSSGGYNNRFGNNYGNNNNQYRNSNTGGSGNNFQNSSGGSGGNMDSGVGGGDYNMNRAHLFSPALTHLSPQQQNTQNNLPFSMRFNQRNQQQQQQQQQNNMNQRHSLPFATPRGPNFHFNSPQARIQPLFPQQQPAHQQQLSNITTPDLFGGLPPPTTSLGMEQNNNPLFSGLPPPTQPQQQSNNFSRILSVPPPPTPPIGVNFAWGPSTAPQSNVFGPVSRANENIDDVENNNSECPNYSVYSSFSKDHLKSKGKPLDNKNKENEENQEDGEREEDLVQLDDDEEDAVDVNNILNENIALPPERNEAENDLYEPENPTEEDEEHEEEKETDDPQTHIEKQSNIIDEEDNTRQDKEIEYATEQMTGESDVCKSADGGDDDDNGDGDDSSDSESDTEKNHKSCEENINKDAEKNENTSPANNKSDAKNKTGKNRKGVLELYDDSDWEELDIDKPQELAAATTTTQIDTSDEVIDNNIDRSYTPCLDEPIENEIENLSAGEPETEAATQIASIVPTETNVLQTELISDEEIHTRPGNRLRSKSKGRTRSRSRIKERAKRRSRSVRRNSAERFKKVSNRQKERNYRGMSSQKQQNKRGTRTERRRSCAPRSRSHSPMHTERYRTRSRSRSLRRQQARRSRSRSPLLQHHRFSRSPRKLSRSRSRTPNRRGRVFRSRSRPLRSRSRSVHNKENFRYKNNSNNNSNNRRNDDKSMRSNKQRPKRRELPRYDVRNVINSQSQRFVKDRYGRDATRPHSRSGSRDRPFVRARSFSRPPRSRTPSPPQRPPRIRRASFSMSPTPTPPPLHYNQQSMPRQGSLSPVPHYQSPPLVVRYISPSPIPQRLNGGRKLPREHSPSPPMSRPQHMQRSRTPSLLRMPQGKNFQSRKSRSVSVNADRIRHKKKKSKERKKKRIDKKSSGNNVIRVQSPLKQEFELEKVTKKKRRHATATKHWSPNSPAAAVVVNELVESHENIGWTPPPREGERLLMEVRRSLSVESQSKLDKHKRQKKKQKTKDKRKDKRRTRRTMSNEPQPSKEVFASGNNILVSVSFNKDSNAASNSANTSSIPQTTVVTLPPHREDILDKRHRRSYENGKKQRDSQEKNAVSGSTKKRDKMYRRRTKIDAKPVAIIDLERSPFQVQQDLMDIIVLTDSEDANEKESTQTQRRLSIMSTSAGEEEDIVVNKQQQKTGGDNSKIVESMDESYEQQQSTTTTVLSNIATGPKTPPEPHVVKFNIQNKKTLNVRSVLHDEVSDGMSEDEQQQCREEAQHRESGTTPINEQSTNANKMVVIDNAITDTVVAQKIGPNTPPESAPCSPDAYDPFEPTKSPSISPSSPTPSNSAQTTLNDISADSVATTNVDLNKSVEQQQQLVSSTNNGVPTHITNTAATQTSLNAADLVMAFMNNKSNNSNNDTTHIPGVGDDVISNNNKHDVGTEISANGLHVLSNVLLHSPVGANLLGLGNKLTQLPALGGSVGSSSSGMVATGAGGQNISNNNNNNASSILDDSFNITDFDSPYSPGSADYEDLFEPPPDSSKQRGGIANNKRGKVNVFDNLFGSSSPPLRQPNSNLFATTSQRKQGYAPGRSKGNKSKDHKSYDDVPISAVDLQMKDKLLRKLNRQERVVEEVKTILKPRFNKKQITKDDYKEIMRRAVPKICHNKSGEINPRKIKNLIEAYVKKFRAKHKKLNLLNTGQVSSAVKCAAYLKKL